MLLDKERDILGSLEAGQAVVKLQGRIARPFQITVPEFIIQKGNVTDSWIQEYMKRIAPVIDKEDFCTLAEKKTTCYLSQASEDLIIAFIKDIQEYPDSHCLKP
jgi:hypothetical protein